MDSKKSKQKVFHIWVPDIFSRRGGTQTYSSFFLNGLKVLEDDADLFVVFLKNDLQASSLTSITLDKVKFHYFGQNVTPWRTIVYTCTIILHALVNKPCLIISLHLNFLPLAFFLKWFMGISYWGVAHGVEAWSITNPVLKIALRQADKILAVSHYTGNRMYDVQNLSPQQIQILPNTFSAQQFTPAAKPSYLLQDYGLHHDQNIILTVARLSKSEGYKGYDRIIQALPKIRLAIPSVHYLLVGKGDDQSRIEHLIEQLDLQHHVTLIGFVPDEQLCAHYNLCDVFAMPSKGEGFGIVYLEAMACGKPCLGGNQDGALDALVQGELGVLVNPDDIDEIAQALIQILQGEYPNALLYQPERLRQAVIEHFGFEIFQQQLCEYLQDFLAA